MRKCFIAAIFLSLFCSLLASPVDSTIAKTVALNFMDSKRISPNTILNLVSEQQYGQNAFFVVNFNEGGWVLVSAIRNTVPV